MDSGDDSLNTADLTWLGSPAAQQLMAKLAGQPEIPALVARLRGRESLSPRRCAMLLEQIRVRQRAAGGKSKFPKSFASRMTGTETGFEQATDAWIAAYKADQLVRRWRRRSFGVSPDSIDVLHSPLRPHVIDLCCGIGGDAMAMARRCRVTGVERDPYTAWCAQWNLGVTDSGSQILVDDATTLPLGEYDVVHIDPDRRGGGEHIGRIGGGRTTFLGAYQPPRDVLDRMIDEHSCVVIKMAPGTAAPSEWARRAELEWISRDRECRQQLAWFGGLTNHPGMRRATTIFPVRDPESKKNPDENSPTGDENHNGSPPCNNNFVEYVVRTIFGRPGPPVRRDGYSDRRTPIPQPHQWIVEPDVAVLAADLTGEIADRINAEPLTSDGAYLLTDPPTLTDPPGAFDTPTTVPDELYGQLPIRIFEYPEVMPDDPSQLRARLEQLDLGNLELKLRDQRLASRRTEADVHRAIFGRRLKLRGRGTAVLFTLETVDGHRLTILAKRRPTVS